MNRKIFNLFLIILTIFCLFSCPNETENSLIITIKEDSTNIGFDIITFDDSNEKIRLENPISLKYKIDGEQYRDYPWGDGAEDIFRVTEGPINGKKITLNKGQRIFFKGSDNITLSKKDVALRFFSSEKVEVSGTIMGLLKDSSNIPNDYCFNSLFKGCENLLTAPTLPNKELKAHCYKSMFEGCTSLIQAPVLPATELKDSCYKSMFKGCSSLSTVYSYAENIPDNSTTDWLKDVANTGTFFKSANAEWERGDSGIPSGWTITDIKN